MSKSLSISSTDSSDRSFDENQASASGVNRSISPVTQNDEDEEKNSCVQIPKDELMYLKGATPKDEVKYLKVLSQRQVICKPKKYGRKPMLEVKPRSISRSTQTTNPINAHDSILPPTTRAHTTNPTRHLNMGNGGLRNWSSVGTQTMNTWPRRNPQVSYHQPRNSFTHPSAPYTPTMSNMVIPRPPPVPRNNMIPGSFNLVVRPQPPRLPLNAISMNTQWNNYMAPWNQSIGVVSYMPVLFPNPPFFNFNNGGRIP